MTDTKMDPLGTVIVPDGKRGDWSIESFTVSQKEADLYNLLHLEGKEAHHRVEAGDFKRLMHYCEEREKNEVVMSNTPMEVITNRAAADMATGRVLINGLGLGMLLHYILQKPDVTEVVVVEQSKDVIDLVAPTFLPNPKVSLAWGDAFTYPPTGTFDFVWHDIWTYVSDENLKEMDELESKYAHVAARQLSWERAGCERMGREMADLIEMLKALRGVRHGS